MALTTRLPRGSSKNPSRPTTCSRGRVRLLPSALRPVRGQSVYAATKGALESFTRAIAVEYGKKGIRALCLRPGAVDTAMLAATRELGEAEMLARIPLRRVAAPEEIGELAAFLLSDKARYLTGSEHSIDGGYLVS